MNTSYISSQKQYQKQGYYILKERIPSTLLQQVKDSIDIWIDDYQIEKNHAVFEIRPKYQTHEEELFKSAENIYGFLEQDVFNQRGQLKVPKDQAFNKIGHALHDFIPEIKALAQHELIQQCRQIAVWQAAHLVQSMVIFKSPHIGAELPWHQDATYLITSPQRVFGIWIALEDATIENGCLWMAPGKHHSSLRERYQVNWSERKGEKHPLSQEQWPQDYESTPIEVSAGSIIMFHDHMPHKSHSNRSQHSRKALTFHCHDAQATWETVNWLHRPNLDPFIISVS